MEFRTWGRVLNIFYLCLYKGRYICKVEFNCLNEMHFRFLLYFHTCSEVIRNIFISKNVYRYGSRTVVQSGVSRNVKNRSDSVSYRRRERVVGHHWFHDLRQRCLQHRTICLHRLRRVSIPTIQIQKLKWLEWINNEKKTLKSDLLPLGKVVWESR